MKNGIYLILILLSTNLSSGEVRFQEVTPKKIREIGRYQDLVPESLYKYIRKSYVFVKGRLTALGFRLVKTELQDDENDEGYRTVYLRGGNFTASKGKGTSGLVAVKDAVKRSGAPDGIQLGGKLTMQYSGEAPAPAKGMNPAKLYTAAYQPPVYAVELDDLA